MACLSNDLAENIFFHLSLFPIAFLPYNKSPWFLLLLLFMYFNNHFPSIRWKHTVRDEEFRCGPGFMDSHSIAGQMDRAGLETCPKRSYLHQDLKGEWEMTNHIKYWMTIPRREATSLNVLVVIWIRMPPIGSYICSPGFQLVDFLGRIMRHDLVEGGEH